MRQECEEAQGGDGEEGQVEGRGVGSRQNRSEMNRKAGRREGRGWGEEDG